MTEAELAQRKIRKYLRTLAIALRGFSARGICGEQVRDIVAELESHIADKTADDVTLARVEAVLAELGKPEDLASLYLTEDLQTRALASRSPLLVLHSQFRWASLSFAGFFALLGSLCSYFLSLAFIACALLKPIHPATAGLWSIPETSGPSFSLRMGFSGAPPGATELLGWSIIPIGLIAGFALFFLTTQSGLWSIRRLRHARPPIG